MLHGTTWARQSSTAAAAPKLPHAPSRNRGSTSINHRGSSQTSRAPAQCGVEQLTPHRRGTATADLAVPPRCTPQRMNSMHVNPLTLDSADVDRRTHTHAHSARPLRGRAPGLEPWWQATHHLLASRSSVLNTLAAVGSSTPAAPADVPLRSGAHAGASRQPRPAEVAAGALPRNPDDDVGLRCELRAAQLHERDVEADLRRRHCTVHLDVALHTRQRRDRGTCPLPLQCSTPHGIWLFPVSRITPRILRRTRGQKPGSRCCGSPERGAATGAGSGRAFLGWPTRWVLCYAVPLAFVQPCRTTCSRLVPVQHCMCRHYTSRRQRGGGAWPPHGSRPPLTQCCALLIYRSTGLRACRCSGPGCICDTGDYAGSCCAVSSVGGHVAQVIVDTAQK